MIEGHVLDQLADYVLGCLGADERALVEQHLVRCDVCRTEWLALQETAGQLALAAPSIEPPPRLKKAVLHRVTPWAERLRARRPVWRGRLQGWLQSASPAWAAVSLVLILALAASNLLMWGQVRQLSNPVEPQMRTIALVGDQTQPRATGLLVLTASGRSGTLVVDRLTMLDAQHQYQLWLIMDGQRTNGGVFSVDNEGYNAMVIESQLPLTSYQNFGVTIEPVGGSPGPTGERVLSGHL